MAESKHYVYSARTTEKGLALLNKAKGEMSWDQFINTAVKAHYGLDLDLNLPPSKFLADQAAKREARAAEKAAKQAEREAQAKAKEEAKEAATKAKKTAAKKPVAKKAAKKGDSKNGKQ
jgi:hypothetical protein